jgi:site-specific recombinase XerD
VSSSAETITPEGFSPGAALVLPSEGALAAPLPPLASAALAKLDADLGQVQVGRVGSRRWYRRRLALLAEAVDPATFDVIVRWLTSTRRASINTKRNYVDDIRRVWAGLARELGHEVFSLGCLHRDDIRLWRLRQEAQGAAKSTIARYLGSLSSLHVYAAEVCDPPPRNPVTQDDRPHVDKGNTSTSTPILEIEEVQAVAARARSPLDLLVIELLYTLAGRVTEICAADVTDLSYRVKGGKRRRYLDVTRKEGKERVLPLSDTCERLLDQHLAGRTEGPLLLDSKGNRLDRHDVDRISTRMGRDAGVLPGRALTAHIWRASRITHMLDDQVPLAEVQEFADHDNPATTVGYWNRRKKGKRTLRHVDAGEAVFTGAADRWLTTPED